MPRLFCFLAAGALCGCSLLVPLDEYGTGATSGGGTDPQGAGGQGGGGGGAGVGGAVSCDDGTPLGSETNCGACGHDCLETTCEDGECKALPFFTDANIAFLDIAFKDAVGPPNLYIAAADPDFTAFYVARFDTSDEDPNVWAIDFDWYIVAKNVVYRLLVAGNYLHFSDAEGIARIDTREAAPADLASVRLSGAPGAVGRADLAVNTLSLYRAAPADDVIAAYAFSGGALGKPLATESPWGIAALSNRLYWTSRSDPGGVYFVAGEGVETAQTGGVPGGMALAGSYVYWAQCRDGNIWRLDVSDVESEPELVASEQSHPFFITAQGSDVYWVNLNQDVCDTPDFLDIEVALTEGAATLMGGRSDGAPPLVLKSGLRAPTSIAVSGDFVYVAQNATTGGELLRVAR
jgi:hypothetical protein